MIPHDPVMLLSFVNMKLRDQYPSLEALLDDLDLTTADIVDRLADIGYHYDATLNQFK